MEATKGRKVLKKTKTRLSNRVRNRKNGLLLSELPLAAYNYSQSRISESIANILMTLPRSNLNLSMVPEN